MERTSDFARRELAGPDLPEEALYLWDWFFALHTRRVFLPEVGHMPITWEAIYAFTRLRDIRLSAWELQMIEALDLAWLAGVSRGKKEGADADDELQA